MCGRRKDLPRPAKCTGRKIRVNRHFAWGSCGLLRSCFVGSTSRTRLPAAARDDPVRNPRGADYGRESRDASTRPGPPSSAVYARTVRFSQRISFVFGARAGVPVLQNQKRCRDLLRLEMHANVCFQRVDGFSVSTAVAIRGSASGADCRAGNAACFGESEIVRVPDEMMSCAGGSIHCPSSVSLV